MNTNFDFPDYCEWQLGKYNDVFIGKKPQQGYDFDIWRAGEPSKSLARFKTKTPKQMAEKIKKLVVKLNKKKK